MYISIYTLILNEDAGKKLTSYCICKASNLKHILIRGCAVESHSRLEIILKFRGDDERMIFGKDTLCACNAGAGSCHLTPIVEEEKKEEEEAWGCGGHSQLISRIFVNMS